MQYRDGRNVGSLEFKVAHTGTIQKDGHARTFKNQMRKSEFLLHVPVQSNTFHDN